MEEERFGAWSGKWDEKPQSMASRLELSIAKADE